MHMQLSVAKVISDALRIFLLVIPSLSRVPCVTISSLREVPHFNNYLLNNSLRRYFVFVMERSKRFESSSCIALSRITV